MGFRFKSIKIFSANSHPALAGSIASQLSLTLGHSEVGEFSDGEISLSIYDTVRGCDVFVIQSTSAPVNNNLMELLIMIDALKRASAGRITAVVPYFGYARQDRKAKAHDPISAKLIANLITAAGADRVLTMDLHSPQIQGFFDIPVDDLKGVPILADYVGKKFKDSAGDVVVVSPDLGSVTRARDFAARCGMSLAVIDKRRERANVSEVCNIIGDVRGKTAILVDDIIDTAGSICNAARAIAEIGGAKEVYACATHAVLSGEALERLRNSPIKETFLLDTIGVPQEKRLGNMTFLSVTMTFAEAIERIYEELPVSPLFR